VSDVRLTVAARSDVGRVRTNNEDAFNVTDLATGAGLNAGLGGDAIDVRDKGVLLALTDGMGGHQAGEVASALVLESLRTAMQTGLAGGADTIEAKIEAAVQRANADVARAARANRSGMGATLTAVFIGGVDAFVAEVGDSRAYLLRAGRLRQITRDQSLVQMLVDKGLLSKEDAKLSPHKNVILQAMGLADDVRVAIARLHLRRGDRLLLCSDGVSNSVPDDELRDILATGDPAAACQRLIDRGNERGGEDNLTAIVAEVDGAGLALPRPAESVTATFEVIKDFAEVQDKGAPTPSPGQRERVVATKRSAPPAGSQPVPPRAAGAAAGAKAHRTPSKSARATATQARVAAVIALVVGAVAAWLALRWFAG
jgi:serine/threonine protein phosphatase PrpC